MKGSVRTKINGAGSTNLRTYLCDNPKVLSMFLSQMQWLISIHQHLKRCGRGQHHAPSKKHRKNRAMNAIVNMILSTCTNSSMHVSMTLNMRDVGID